MLNATVDRRYLWVQVSPSVCRLTTCCADVPAHSHHSLGILRGARHSSPCRMIRIYRRAIANADLAIAASGWAVLLWRLIQRHSHFRSGTLQSFARNAAGACSSKPFFVLPRMQSGVRQIRRCSDFFDGYALMAASRQIWSMDLRLLV
jgi:hypothetical protein